MISLSVSEKTTKMGELKAIGTDMTMKAGDYFGEKALVSGEPRTANYVALTDVLEFRIDNATFERVRGKLSKLILRTQEQNALKAIPMMIQAYQLDEPTLLSLTKLIKERKFKAGEYVFIPKMSRHRPQCVTLVKIMLKYRRVMIPLVIKVVGDGFGEEPLHVDAKVGNWPTKMLAKAIPTFTGKVLGDSFFGVLTLDDFRKILDTQFFGKAEHFL